MKQRSLAREVSIQGQALHTGESVTLTMKPAPVNHGIVFRRVDLPGQPEIPPRVELVTDLVRATTIQAGHAKIHTVEHVLSALHGCGVDNVLIEEHQVDLSDTIVDVAGNPSTEIANETGTGRAVLFRDGRAIVGSWTRDSIDSPVEFKTKSGDSMVFKPGTIWIHLVPSDAGEVTGSFDYAK